MFINFAVFLYMNIHKKVETVSLLGQLIVAFPCFHRHKKMTKSLEDSFIIINYKNLNAPSFSELILTISNDWININTNAKKKYQLVKSEMQGSENKKRKCLLE